MRRLLLLLAAIMCCICLVACGDEDDSSRRRRSQDDEVSDPDDEEKDDSDDAPIGKKAKKTPTPTNVPKKTPTVTEKEPAHYFGNRSVQYEKENAWHQVFFSFSVTEDGENVRQEATIHLSITNDKGELVYRKDHKVTERDYGMWTSSINGSRLLGCIYIKDSEITPGSSSDGALAISAELSNGYYWEEDKIRIYDLPLKTLQIIMPSMPLTITEYDYRGGVQRKAEIISVAYEVSEYGMVTLNATVKLIENNDSYSATGYCMMTFKLKNSSGVIVQSGMLMAGPMAVGDTVLCNQMIAYDLDRNEEYTLELVDYR